ncbi:hypothetical protein Gotur_017719 [Gossypium turneri]
MIEVVLNDRLGKKVRVKCNDDDTIGDLKKLVAAQTGTRADKIRIQKWYTVYKDHITLKDYEIHDGLSIEENKFIDLDDQNSVKFTYVVPYIFTFGYGLWKGGHN